MTAPRQMILDLAEQGRIAPQQVRQALLLTGVLPTKPDWQHFLDQLLLWLGTSLVSAGVIFFFAYNWNALGRHTKFGLVEALVVAALLCIWRLGLEGIAGKAALLAASLFVGTLLALIGQTYQTGADTFELFGVWAGAILPWVLVGRFAALWVLWLVVVHVALGLYYQTFGGLFGLVFGPEEMVWVVLLLSTGALVVWEAYRAYGVTWLHERWATRFLATASGSFMTTLAVFSILESLERDSLGFLVWLVWLGAAYVVYRHLMLDVYVLAGSVLSVTIVMTCFLGRYMLPEYTDASSFLFLGLIVIGLSAAGGWWLKQVVAQKAV